MSENSENTSNRFNMMRSALITQLQARKDTMRRKYFRFFQAYGKPDDQSELQYTDVCIEQDPEAESRLFSLYQNLKALHENYSEDISDVAVQAQLQAYEKAYEAEIQAAKTIDVKRLRLLEHCVQLISSMRHKLNLPIQYVRHDAAVWAEAIKDRLYALHCNLEKNLRDSLVQIPDDLYTQVKYLQSEVDMYANCNEKEVIDLKEMRKLLNIIRETW